MAKSISSAQRSACAQMLDLEKGEVVEWVITGKGDLMLKRSPGAEKESAADE